MPEIQQQSYPEQKPEKDPVEELQDKYYAMQGMCIASVLNINYIGFTRDKVNKFRDEKNVPSDQSINEIFNEAKRAAELDAVYKDDGKTLKDIEASRSAALNSASQARVLANAIEIKKAEVAKEKEAKAKENLENERKELEAEKIRKEEAEGRMVKEWVQKELDSQKADSLLMDMVLGGMKESMYQRYGTLGEYCKQIDSFVNNPRIKLPTLEEFNSAYEGVYNHYQTYLEGDSRANSISALEHFRGEYAARLHEMLKIQPIRLKGLSK